MILENNAFSILHNFHTLRNWNLYEKCWKCVISQFMEVFNLHCKYHLHFYSLKTDFRFQDQIHTVINSIYSSIVKLVKTGRLNSTRIRLEGLNFKAFLSKNLHRLIRYTCNTVLFWIQKKIRDILEVHLSIQIKECTEIFTIAACDIGTLSYGLLRYFIS